MDPPPPSRRGYKKKQKWRACFIWRLSRPSGPREPWHDIHCRVEGPAAWDVLTNFEQRWRKQAGRPEKLLDLRYAGLYVPDNVASPGGDARVQVVPPDDPEAWRVQVCQIGTNRPILHAK
jgi:phosphatidylserine/phosphatidylglycerophosphate/cardiolipin synthase-like enzyme